jgi:hypothetical protein
MSEGCLERASESERESEREREREGESERGRASERKRETEREGGREGEREREHLSNLQRVTVQPSPRARLRVQNSFLFLQTPKGVAAKETIGRRRGLRRRRTQKRLLWLRRRREHSCRTVEPGIKFEVTLVKTLDDCVLVHTSCDHAVAVEDSGGVAMGEESWERHVSSRSVPN